ncbi:unnamed protein product, partial [Choristocarpus tenellus]
SSSSSTPSTSSSSASYSSDESDGLLEDLASVMDSNWLKDVQGTARGEFFELFKNDITPQFSRPSFNVLGRHGIGSSFIDGQPNIKYLPQKPLCLPGNSSTSRAQPQPSETAFLCGNGMQLPRKTESHRSKAENSRRSTDLSVKVNTPSSVKKGTSLASEQESCLNAMMFNQNQPSVSVEVIDQPQTIHVDGSKGQENGLVCATTPAKAYQSGVRTSIDRPKTPSEAALPPAAWVFEVPHLSDPSDPAMIACRRMKRPSSPRRDYLMSCAEQQLMPVPVINAGLHLHTSPQQSATGDTQFHKTRHIKGPTQEKTNAPDDTPNREGRIVLRHYYLGESRVQCLESMMASVPVTFREVDLTDSGLDDEASEKILEMLYGRAGTITSLDMSGNRMGTSGAEAIARYAATKGCSLHILKLAGNKAGNSPMMTVLKALCRHKPPISRLYLSDNKISLVTVQ